MSTKQRMSVAQMGVFVAALSMYFMAPTHSVINAVSVDIMNTYGVDENAVSYLISITNLLAMPAAFLVGFFGGRKVGYKPLALIATGLVVIGGLPTILGAALPFWALMATRCILGLGLGAFFPVAQTIVALLFTHENTRATMFGIASVIFSIGMIAITSLAGILGAITWNLAWGVYLIALVPFLLVLFLFQKNSLPVAAGTEDKKEKVKIVIPIWGWGLLLLFLLSIIMSQSLFNIGGSTVGAIVENPAIIGTIFSSFSIGAIITAATFGILYKFLKAYCVPVYFAIGLIGYFLWWYGHITGEVTMFYAGIILAGLGTNALTIGVGMILSTAVAPGVVAAVMGFSYLFQNGGGFIASPIDQVVATVFGSQISVYMFNVVLGVLILVGLIFVAMKAVKSKYVAPDDSAAIGE